MIDTDDFLAMRYACGVADLAEIAAVESRMDSDSAFAALIARFDQLFSGLEAGQTEVAPPEGLWARIEVAIDDLEKVPGTHTVRTQAMAWEPFLPGVERKILFADKTGASSLVLYKVAAGASVGNHSHGITEECLVLEGELEIDGITLRPGDLHMAFPHERHGPLYSRTGALVYIRGDLQIHP